MKKPIIFIINCYTWKNKGDGAIAETTVRLIQREHPEANIVISTFDVKSDKAYYAKYGVNVVPQILSLWQRKSKLSSLLYLALHIIDVVFFWLTMGKFHLLSTYRETWEAYRNSNLIISVGGGYITSSPAKFGTIWLGIHLLSIEIGLRLSIPTVMQSQSIGPFIRPLDTKIVSKVLRRISRVTVRDDISYKEAISLGVPPTCIYRAPDYAFLQHKAPDDEVRSLFKREQGKPCVGVSVRHWVLPLKPGAFFQMDKYINAVAEFCSQLSRNVTNVILIPQVTKIGDDDSVETWEVYNRCNHRENINVVDTKDLSPAQMKTLYANLDLLIGTRMHANIMALGSGVPVVAIAYHMKTVGIMDDLGLSDWCIAIEDVTATSLFELYNKAMENQHLLRTKIKSAIAELEMKVLNNLQGDLSMIKPSAIYDK